MQKAPKDTISTYFGTIALEYTKLSGPFGGTPRFTERYELRHVETDIAVVIDNSRLSSKGMLQRGLRILRARVLSGGEYRVSERDRVRTYHTSPFGTWTRCHRTGAVLKDVFLEVVK